MREIKFRVWDHFQKIFVDSRCKTNGTEISVTFDGALIISGIDGFYDLESKRYTVQQFTGFLDKKGKEIYEGDIIATRVADDCIPNLEKHKYTLIVFFCDKGKWKAKEKMDEYAGSSFPFFDDHYEILLDKTKVIGNIFENPDLLNGSK